MSKDKNKDRTIESKDLNDNDVKVVIKRPSIKDMRDSQIVYNKSFKEALDGGAILKKKLSAYISEQGIWDEEKDKRYDAVVDEMQTRESDLRKGGIPLLEARDIALKLRLLRDEFRLLVAEKSEMDSNTAESIADNSRFNFLVTRCVRGEKNDMLFTSEEDYDAKADEPWAFEAAAELANVLYELDPDFNKNLEENKFLFNYKFCNNDLQLVNKEGHLIDVDDNGTERLINENGRYIAYKDEAEQTDPYFINRKGEEVDEEGNPLVEFSPFLDDKGKPVTLETEGDDSEEEAVEETAEEKTTEEVAEKPKKSRKKASTAKNPTEAG